MIYSLQDVFFKTAVLEKSVKFTKKQWWNSILVMLQALFHRTPVDGCFWTEVYDALIFHNTWGYWPARKKITFIVSNPYFNAHDKLVLQVNHKDTWPMQTDCKSLTLILIVSGPLLTWDPACGVAFGFSQRVAYRPKNSRWYKKSLDEYLLELTLNDISKFSPPHISISRS